MRKKIVLLSVLLSISFSVCSANNKITTHSNSLAIDERLYIRINGISEYLLIRGENINNPVILYIHGGPGIPYTSLLYNMIEELKDEYTFVAYDQRGVGRTYYETQRTKPENNVITKELLLKDLDSTVDYLRKRFRRDKIIILGHSYGSLMGITYLNAHPEKVSHYIGLAQSVNRSEVFKVTYKKARKLLEEGSKKQQKLDQDYIYVTTHSDTKRTMDFQKELDKILEKNMEGLIKPKNVEIALASPDFKGADLRYFASFMNMKKLIERNKESMKWLEDANLMKENTTFTIPMSFISGEYDETCPLELIKTYVDKIKAPYKNFAIIPHVGHSPQLADPIATAKAIKEELNF